MFLREKLKEVTAIKSLQWLFLILLRWELNLDIPQFSLPEVVIFYFLTVIVRCTGRSGPLTQRVLLLPEQCVGKRSLDELGSALGSCERNTTTPGVLFRVDLPVLLVNKPVVCTAHLAVKHIDRVALVQASRRRVHFILIVYLASC